MLIGSVPVDPDVDEARDWIIRELSKPPYRAAEPSWFDRLASAFWDWLTSLTFAGTGAPGLIWGIVVFVVIGALIALYFIFGPPRSNRRAAATGALFGVDDARDADALRRSARDAAAASDYELAIEELFRAIARSLSERGIVDTFPGTTAHGFATTATVSFPDHEGPLRDSAADFDAVRYLDRPGTEAAWERMVALDAALQAARPADALAVTGAIAERRADA